MIIKELQKRYQVEQNVMMGVIHGCGMDGIRSNLGGQRAGPNKSSWLAGVRNTVCAWTNLQLPQRALILNDPRHVCRERLDQTFGQEKLIYYTVEHLHYITVRLTSNYTHSSG